MNKLALLLLACAAAGCQPQAPGAGPSAPAANSQKAQAAKAPARNRVEETLTMASAADTFYDSADDQLATLQDDGVLPKKSKLRFDYVTYYKPIHETRYQGDLELLYFEHEYMEQYIGCCVNEGFGLLLAGTPDEKLRSFASQHNCAIKDAGQFYIDPSLEKDLPKGPVFELSCRAQDGVAVNVAPN